MDASRPGSGPAETLSALARRLRLPFDPENLADRVADHATPRSLLALVEVAQTVGLTARGFHAEWDDLTGTKLPAVVHLQGKDDSGFALLLEHGPGGVVLEVPPARAPVRLDRERFTSLWSGAVVLFDKDPSARAAPESSPGLLRTGAPLAGPRGAAMVGLALLAFAGAIHFGAEAGSFVTSIVAATVCALTFTAASLSAVLLLASRRSRVPSATPALVSKICGRGSLLDCEGVLGSKYARLGRIELSVLGVALFGGAAVLEAIAGLLPAEARAGLAGWLALAFAGAAPGALALVGVQVWPLRRFCPLCLTVHACVLLAAALASPFLVQRFEEGLGPVLFQLAPWAVAHAVASLGVAGLLVPFLEAAHENRTHRGRLAWIGSTPWGALAEVAGRPSPRDWGLDGHARLGNQDAPFRADVLVHPTCSGCPPLLESLDSLLARHPRDVQVVLHFPPRDPGRAEDRELCAALAAVGRVQGGPAARDAFLAAKSVVWKLLDASAQGGARAVLAQLAPDCVTDDATLAGARESVERADRVLTELRRGTPTLLLCGLPWDAPLEDLEALLATHPEQLAAVLEVLPRPAEKAPA